MLRQPLLGFHDFFDEVGQAKPPGKPVRSAPGKPVKGAPGKPAPGKPAPAPTGGKAPEPRKYSPPKKTTGMKKHGLVLKKAKDTLLKAARGLGRAQMLLAKKPPAAVRAAASAAMKTAATKATVARQAAVQAQRTPTPATKRAAAVMRGAASKSILGAAAKMVQAKKPLPAVVTAKMSPKAKAAVAKHNAALAAAKKAAQNLAKNTIKAKQSVQKLAKAAINQKKVAKALRTKGARRTAVGELMGHHLIGEEVVEALGEFYEMVGAAPDPMNPGKLTDGSPDPMYSSLVGTDAYGLSAGEPGYDPTTEDGIPASTDGGESLLSEEDLAALTMDEDGLADIDIINAMKDQPIPERDAAPPENYKDVGGILYNESKGRPNGFVGTLGLMYRGDDRWSTDNRIEPDSAAIDGVEHHGFVWGKFEKDGPEKGIRWGADLIENTWNHVHGRHYFSRQGWANPTDVNDVIASVGKNAPTGKVYGPVVGNPALSDFAGLRMDRQGNLFWYPQEAPDWVTQPLVQAAALTEAAEKKAAEDERKQYELEQEKLRRDEAAAQAAQDAANALAESAAASEAKVAATQEETKQLQETTAQAQQETQYQQTLIEQAREEAAAEAQAAQQIIEQAKADAAAEAQAQQLLLQRAQRQEQLLAETPELEAALMVRDAGLLEEGAAEEGGEEYAEEEEPSYEDTTVYSEPEAESDKFRHPMADDDYEASGFEDDGGFDDSGEDLVF